MSYGYIAGEQPNHGPVEHDGILVTKRTVLSNPGSKLNHSLYYSAINTVVQPVEATWTTGRFKQSLSSPQFGAQSTIIIPNGSFVQTMYLNLKMPAALGANMVLPRGWAFSAIQSISYLMGSSNVPQITISGQTMYQLMLAQCESVMKRSEMLALAGQETFGSATNTTIPEANLIIPLPFSVFAGKDSPFPFDTNILMNPITVVIQLAPLRSFCSGVGVSSWAYYGYQRAEVSLRLGDMLNKDAGLRRIMQNNPDLIYGYPFNHFQSFTAGFDAIQAEGQTQTINLLGFINADLLGIIIGVQQATRQAPARANDIINPLIYEEVADVQLLFNGLVMHNTTGDSHKLTGMTSVNDPIYVQQSEVALPAVSGTGPFTSSPVNVYPLYIDFAQVRSMNFFREYENTWRIPSNTITLQLRTPNVTAGTKCVLYATYVYNGVIDTRAGETSVFFS
jgi:hypothetical protein